MQAKIDQARVPIPAELVLRLAQVVAFVKQRFLPFYIILPRQVCHLEQTALEQDDQLIFAGFQRAR